MHYDVTLTDGGFRVIDKRTGEVVKRGTLRDVEDFLDAKEQELTASEQTSAPRRS